MTGIAYFRETIYFLSFKNYVNFIEEIHLEK